MIWKMHKFHNIKKESAMTISANHFNVNNDTESATGTLLNSHPERLTSELSTYYDLTVIASLDTLMGVDCLELAYRASYQAIKNVPLTSERIKPRLNIQLLGIEGGWNATLDSSMLYSIDSQWLEQLSEQKRAGNPSYQDWHSLKQHTVNPLEAIATSTILLCLPKGQLCASLLQQAGKQIIDLTAEALSPLEALGNWLNEPLLSIDEAHATYYRNYLPGLAFQGIPYKKDSKAKTGPAQPCVEAILERKRLFQTSVTSDKCTKLDIDACWRGINLAGKSAQEKQKFKQEKDVCLYLVDEASIELRADNSRYADYKESFLETLDEQYCQYHYEETQHKRQQLTLPTNLILYCTKPRATEDTSTPSVPRLSRVERIEFTTSKNEAESLHELSRLPELQGLATITVISRQFSHYFRADISQHTTTNSHSVVDLVVDHLLAISLDGERPLVSYGSTFFLPFRLAEKHQTIEPKADEREVDYQELITDLANEAEIHQSRSSGTVVTTQGNLKLNLEEGERFNLIANERDAFLYLDPVVRQRLCNLNKDDGQRIVEWRAPVSMEDEIKGNPSFVWAINNPNDTTLPCTQAWVRSVKLHQFYNDVYILSVNVYERFFQGEGNTSFTSGGHDWWHDLFTDKLDKQQQIEQSKIRHWLRYSEKMRQLYPSFAIRNRDANLQRYYFGHKSSFHDVEEKATPRELNFEDLTQNKYCLPPDVSNILQTLGIENGTTLSFKPFIDNRLFVNVSYGLTGNAQLNARSREKYDALYALAAYVDCKDQAWSSLGGYAYDPAFTKNLIESQSYKRWDAMGNRYAFSNYANVYVGYGTEFNNIIAPCHVFYNYQNMLLLALFYRESLHDFREQIAELSQHIETASPSVFEPVRQEFIRFTNLSWFQELSSQIQGKEIYQKILQGLDIKKEYEFLEKEIAVTHQHFQAVATETFTKLAFVLALLALIGSAYSLYLPIQTEKKLVTLYGVPLLVVYVLILYVCRKHIVRLGEKLKHAIPNIIKKMGYCFYDATQLERLKTRYSRGKKPWYRKWGYWLWIVMGITILFSTNAELAIWQIVTGRETTPDQLWSLWRDVIWMQPSQRQ
ncbi:hypothetical protein NMS64_001695 [Vibrio cholerae]|nr:hypothetical protein [Vibrio cholerae]EJL6671958.1 hypothetical protein [Vibrio cholerae]